MKKSRRQEFRGKPTSEKILEQLPYVVSGTGNSQNISFLFGLANYNNKEKK